MNITAQAMATVLALAGALPAAAQPAPPSVPYEARNPQFDGTDLLGPARRTAAAVVFAAGAHPQHIVDVGSFTGELLEAFLTQFPTARGQWTEPVATNEGVARARLARFGDRVDYRIGCPGRDLAQGCVPAGTDMLLTSWLTIHQNMAGIRAFEAHAAAILPAGGWLVVVDHAADEDRAWDKVLDSARDTLGGEHLASLREGPPVHHPDFVLPTLTERLASLRASGFDHVHVIWNRLDTYVIIARRI